LAEVMAVAVIPSNTGFSSCLWGLW